MASDALVSWKSPGPGAWTCDRTHATGPLAPYGVTMLGRTIPTAVAAGFERTGITNSGSVVAQVHGWTYTQPKPLDPETFADREAAARDFLENRRWEEQLRRWSTAAPELERACRALQQVDVAGLDNVKLADHLDAGIRLAVEGATWHFEQTALCVLIGELLLSCREWGFHDAEVLPLLRGSSPASADTAAHLDRIAEALRAADVRPTSLDETRTASSDAARALDDYLDEHGLRPVGSFDLGAKTLLEMPEIIVSSIHSALDAPPRLPLEPADAALLRSRVPEDDRARFDDLLAAARSVYGLRDDDVSYLLWARGVIRRALLEAADRFVSTGRLHERDDVLEMSPSEVRELLHGSGTVTANAVRTRRDLRSAAALLDPPRSLGGDVAPAELGSLPPTTRRLTAAYAAYFTLRKAASQRGQLTGVGIGTTTYRGRAVVARWADEAFAKLEPGDVLVTSLTTPAFNSVLSLCGALVVEEAGVLSHAAVMARELDLAAVVGVLNATSLIPDGADVEVDPRSGVVRVL